MGESLRVTLQRPVPSSQWPQRLVTPIWEGDEAGAAQEEMVTSSQLPQGFAKTSWEDDEKDAAQEEETVTVAGHQAPTFGTFTFGGSSSSDPGVGGHTWGVVPGSCEATQRNRSVDGVASTASHLLPASRGASLECGGSGYLISEPQEVSGGGFRSDNEVWQERQHEQESLLMPPQDADGHHSVQDEESPQHALPCAAESDDRGQGSFQGGVASSPSLYSASTSDDLTRAALDHGVARPFLGIEDGPETRIVGDGPVEGEPPEYSCPCRARSVEPGFFGCGTGGGGSGSILFRFLATTAGTAGTAGMATQSPRKLSGACGG